MVPRELNIHTYSIQCHEINILIPKGMNGYIPGMIRQIQEKYPVG